MSGSQSVQVVHFTSAFYMPPSPGTLRKAEGTLPTAPILIPDPGLSSTASASALELLNSQAGPEDDHSVAVGDATITECR